MGGFGLCGRSSPPHGLRGLEPGLGALLRRGGPGPSPKPPSLKGRPLAPLAPGSLGAAWAFGLSPFPPQPPRPPRPEGAAPTRPRGRGAWPHRPPPGLRALRGGVHRVHDLCGGRLGPGGTSLHPPRPRGPPHGVRVGPLGGKGGGVAGAFPRPSGAFPGQPSAPGQGLPRPQRPPLRAVLPGGHHRYHPGLPRPPAPFRLASSHGAFHRGLRPGPSPRPHGHWPLCRGLGKGRRGALGGLRPPLPGPPSHPGPTRP